jgi:hypothetical protein
VDKKWWTNLLPNGARKYGADVRRRHGIYLHGLGSMRVAPKKLEEEAQPADGPLKVKLSTGCVKGKTDTLAPAQGYSFIQVEGDREGQGPPRGGY